MLDPGGAPFFVRAVHGVRSPPDPGDEALPRHPVARLQGWGFNALGIRSDAGLRDDGLPFLACASVSQGAAQIVGCGVRLPDVFDPVWPRHAAARAVESCGPLAERRDLIGWVSDDGLEWGAPTMTGRPSLLQICLSLEPGFTAYHAAWEFVLALHGGGFDAVAAAWNAALANKEALRELTRAEEGLRTRGYLRDDARWTEEFARRYFAGAAAAIRAADPNHLVFGCRMPAPTSAAVLAACAYPAVDVTMPEWTQLPAPGVEPPQPMLAGDVGWTHADFVRAPTDRGARRLTTLERMLRKARTTLERTIVHPAVVGYVWSQWKDAPSEQPPFGRGLVHVNGAEAREHTEVLAMFNLRAEALRRSASTSLP